MRPFRTEKLAASFELWAACSDELQDLFILLCVDNIFSGKGIMRWTDNPVLYRQCVDEGDDWSAQAYAQIASVFGGSGFLSQGTPMRYDIVTHRVEQFGGSIWHVYSCRLVWCGKHAHEFISNEDRTWLLKKSKLKGTPDGR